MGWYYANAYSERSDRKRLIADLTADSVTPQKTQKCLSHCLRGNVLWTVWEIETKNKDVFRFIGCDLLSYEGKGDACWGHKPMDEDMGPNYYSCPLKYLKMAPNPQTQNSKDWRKDVIRIHSEKRARKKRFK